MADLVLATRADYWKSQTRKYCEFCKCWISDNKPSVQFHENGKRHKAAVEARIKEIGKKTIAAEKAKSQMEREIKKMEDAAMKAYMRDLEENPDMSSRSIAQSHNLSFSSVGPAEAKKTEWHEAKTAAGQVYYWHSVTGESKWELPTEGFIALKDQSIQTSATVNKKPPPKQGKRHNKGKDSKSKKHKGNNTAKKADDDSFEFMGPIAVGRPFGDWETIQTKCEKPVDLQLPVPTHIPVKLSRAVENEEETQVEFKEKTISISQESGGSGSSGLGFGFKRPKNRGNMRQRTSDL